MPNSGTSPFGTFTFLPQLCFFSPRWQPPPEGYLSIKDQEEINKKHEEREMKKYNRIVEQQSIHSHAGAFSATAAAESAAGPAPKADPYGSGGWQKVAKK